MSAAEQPDGDGGPDRSGSEGTSPASPPRWLRHAGLAISVVALGAVVAWALGQPAPSLPSSGVEILALGGALAMYAVTVSLRGERWRMLLRHAGARPSRADCYALMVVGYMGNTVLPARSGDAMRSVMIAPRAQTGIRTAVGTMVAERLLDAGVLVVVFLIVAYGLLPGLETGGAVTAILIAGAALAVGGLILLLLYLNSESPRVARLVAFLAPMAAPTRELRGAHGARMAGFTAMIWVLDSVTILAVAAAVGFHMNPLEALFVLTLTAVITMIPSGPGHLGTFDVGVVVGSRAVGATGGVAVSYLLMLRFVIFVPLTVAGLILLVTRYRSLSWLGDRRATKSA